MRSDPLTPLWIERRLRWLAGAGAVLGLTAVLAGAFGAHSLKASLAPERLAVFETAARYQLAHALALFCSAWVLQSWPSRVAYAAGVCFFCGTVLFSGSLYGLVLIGNSILALVTPAGGAVFLAGWICLIVAVTKPNNPGRTIG